MSEPKCPLTQLGTVIGRCPGRLKEQRNPDRYICSACQRLFSMDEVQRFLEIGVTR